VHGGQRGWGDSTSRETELDFERNLCVCPVGCACPDVECEADIGVKIGVGTVASQIQSENGVAAEQPEAEQQQSSVMWSRDWVVYVDIGGSVCFMVVLYLFVSGKEIGEGGVAMRWITGWMI
jgi:hypothetical protein